MNRKVRALFVVVVLVSVGPIRRHISLVPRLMDESDPSAHAQVLHCTIKSGVRGRRVLTAQACAARLVLVIISGREDVHTPAASGGLRHIRVITNRTPPQHRAKGS